MCTVNLSNVGTSANLIYKENHKEKTKKNTSPKNKITASFFGSMLIKLCIENNIMLKLINKQIL
jgi:hypothetical protein